MHRITQPMRKTYPAANERDVKKNVHNGAIAGVMHGEECEDVRHLGARGRVTRTSDCPLRSADVYRERAAVGSMRIGIQKSAEIQRF
ncbi:MAG: hypothetical protein JW936_02505 [Sedimentisphaerales bacterium]|nr:hypothetical protein [Sedimentisphaerales bacterium]